ncbi:MAG: DNA-binding protein WhiA [Ruminococcaceae bacterium]|nr:DNA-binding protein WhiA [Oscillospiraceae bacterium]
MSSFCASVKREMTELVPKKLCCRKALLMGLLYAAVSKEDKQWYTEYTMEEVAELSLSLLGSVVNTEGERQHCYRGGKPYIGVLFRSKAVFSFLRALSAGETAEQAALFRCDDCKGAFLRGVFLSTASLTDPHKGYHLEFLLGAEQAERAQALFAFLSRQGFVARKAERRGRHAVYFKSNTAISDILYLTGAVRSSFDFANACIERDIRNNENRATNCVATNIAKSVDASQKHLCAIRALQEAHLLSGLPEELYTTAMLRLENEDASLAELALLHRPPISKSGLNHRLQRLLHYAEEHGGQSS